MINHYQLLNWDEDRYKVTFVAANTETVDTTGAVAPVVNVLTVVYDNDTGEWTNASVSSGTGYPSARGYKLATDVNGLQKDVKDATTAAANAQTTADDAATAAANAQTTADGKLKRLLLPFNVAVDGTITAGNNFPTMLEYAQAAMSMSVNDIVAFVTHSTSNGTTKTLRSYYLPYVSSSTNVFSAIYDNKLVEFDFAPPLSTWPSAGDTLTDSKFTITEKANAFAVSEPITYSDNVLGFASPAVNARDLNNDELTAWIENNATTNCGTYSHAEGNDTEASGDYSHAEGGSAVAYGESSHAEGSGTEASNIASHAEGNDTSASGRYGHAEGESTQAYGESSHAEGESTQAFGDYSHAEGFFTIASASKNGGQHAGGRYNVAIAYDSDSEEQTDYLEIIGNGTSDTARSNARTLDGDGTAWFAGDVTCDAVQGEHGNLYSMRAIGAVVASTPTITYGTSNSITVGANAHTLVDVTFPSTLTEVPVVFPAIQCATAGVNLIATVQSVSNTQASICVTNLGTTDVSDVTVDYMALSGR